MNSSYAATNVSSGLVRKLSGLVRRSGLLRKKIEVDKIVFSNTKYIYFDYKRREIQLMA
jgi:hypothetical protein